MSYFQLNFQRDNDSLTIDELIGFYPENESRPMRFIYHEVEFECLSVVLTSQGRNVQILVLFNDDLGTDEKEFVIKKEDLAISRPSDSNIIEFGRFDNGDHLFSIVI